MVNKNIVVIGAGLGGLSAAISLAIDGHRVSVYEKNDKVGGKLNVLATKGFSFDLGPSILTMPHIFETLFTRAGKNMSDYVTIEKVRPHWRNFFEDGMVFDLHPEMDMMEKELAKLSRETVRGFYEFIEYSRSLCKATEQGYFAEGYDTLGEVLRGHGLRKGFSDFDAFRSMDGAVRSFIKNPYLVDTLNYFIKYVGSSPYDAPAILNLMPYVQFGYGLWYVKGGMYNLARGLEQLAKELGIQISCDREVAAIEHAGNMVTGVRLKSGAVVAADIVVSNMEVIPAYTKLLNEDAAFLRSLEKFEPACSGLVLHLGVNKIYPQLVHHNFLYSKDPKHHFDLVFHKKQLPTDPTIYLVAPCKTDPAQAPAGCEIIKVLPHIPHINEEKPYTMDDYRALREVVLNKLERMGLTDLRKHIVVEDMWTPLDIRDKYYSNKGAIYGVVSDRFKNLGFKAPKRSTKYKNLYFVGGCVNPGGGMPMVTLSGQQVRNFIETEQGE